MSISTTTTTKRVSSPGEILREEFLEPLGITPYRLAKAVGVGQTGISEILDGKRSISVAMAWKLAVALGTSPEFWINLQRDYDMLTFDKSQIGDVTPLVTQDSK